MAWCESSMIAFQSHDEAPSRDERPGPREIARRNQETATTIEQIDQPADLLADALDQQVQAYSGPVPTDRKELRRFVVAQFRSSVSVTAVSAMIAQFIEQDEQIHLATALRRMLVVIRYQSDPEITADAIAFALGIHLGEGRTCEEIAEAHGITKQAFSKRVIRIGQDLGLSPSVLMRSFESRRSYQIKQKERHEAARAAGNGSCSMAELRAKFARARQHLSGRELRAAVA